MPPEALRTTVPPVPVPPQQRASRTGLAVIALLVALLAGVAIGIAVGRATAKPPVVAAAPASAPSDAGQLGVTSVPADGNVVVDGRFVGVAPIERVDLAPGKHSVVIDAFGYQPYAGTLAIEPRARVNLKVLLAPIGGGGTTSGAVTGAAKATRVNVPPSALQPPAPAPAPAPAAAVDEPAPRPSRARPARRTESTEPPPAPRDDPPPPPPPRPRRDCNGEKSRCRDSCRRAETDCRFSCPHCVGCPSSVGWDECKRQCESCRTSCDRNTKFCETSCDGQYANCEASNN